MKGFNLDFQHICECCFSAQLVTKKNTDRKRHLWFCLTLGEQNYPLNSGFTETTTRYTLISRCTYVPT